MLFRKKLWSVKIDDYRKFKDAIKEKIMSLEETK